MVFLAVSYQTQLCSADGVVAYFQLVGRWKQEMVAFLRMMRVVHSGLEGEAEKLKMLWSLSNAWEVEGLRSWTCLVSYKRTVNTIKMEDQKNLNVQQDFSFENNIDPETNLNNEYNFDSV